jgi:peptidoglycan/xylan/chitin deacetylase (PgdA/CDA1 family)
METVLLILVMIVLILLLGAAVAVYFVTLLNREAWEKMTLVRAKTSERVVALTFDDGPNPETTPLVLDILKAHGIQATFFVIGSRAEAHPEIVRRMVDEGHAVGNHSFTHSNKFPMIGSEKMVENLDACDKVIKQITGHFPTMFRPPFGVINPPLAKAVEKRYTVIGWDVRSLDTMKRWSRERVFKRVKRRLKPGSVVLLHDDRQGADKLLSMIVNHIERNGWRVERVDKMFGI